MLPPLSSIVPSPWPASRKAQQLAARPWSPCPWAGLSEPANDRARPQADRSRGVASAALEHLSGSAAQSLDSPRLWRAVTDAARRHGRGLRPQCLHCRHRWRQQPRGRPRPPRGPCGAPGRRCGAPVRPGNGRGQPDHHGRGRAPGSPCERRRRGRCRERRRSIPLAQLGPRSTPGRRNAAVEPPGDGHGHGASPHLLSYSTQLEKKRSEKKK